MNLQAHILDAMISQGPYCAESVRNLVDLAAHDLPIGPRIELYSLVMCWLAQIAQEVVRRKNAEHVPDYTGENVEVRA